MVRLSSLLFWGLNVFIIYRGMDWLRAVENWAAPFVLLMTGALVWWAVSRAHGLGPLLAQPGKFHTLREFLPVFVPSLTAMIGYWATLSLNMPDFTRFGRSQREQIVGQIVALPTTMSLFAAISICQAARIADGTGARLRRRRSAARSRGAVS